ncbi:hypothetical protein [Granulicella sibirica]|uniref:hypothetical protein n=1 Tax=Granulicella sibirica TaxID=2479048 RepID=UPI001009380B|nr:hypothetical protein [Granulicella sibirica]
MKFDTAQSAVALVLLSLVSLSPLMTWAEDADLRYAIGTVYYAEGSEFKAVEKEAAPQSGRGIYSAKVKGAHAALRLQAEPHQVFRVCGVDPTRYKLYRFRSDAKTRIITIATNTLLGGYKVVLPESEIQIKIEQADNGCFTLTTQETLKDGELGFSPVDSLDAFMFGIGRVPESR